MSGGETGHARPLRDSGEEAGRGFIRPAELRALAGALSLADERNRVLLGPTGAASPPKAKAETQPTKPKRGAKKAP